VSDGGGFGVAAGAVLAMGRAQGDRQDQLRAQGDWNRIHQVPIGPLQIAITAGAGVYQVPDMTAVRAGFMQSIRRLTASGFSAGTVAVYKSGAVVGGVFLGGGEPISAFAAAGINTLGRAEGLMDMGDNLIFVCTGITLSTGFAGVQINGASDCFTRDFLPDYLA
jgi:hypothetical protein